MRFLVISDAPTLLEDGLFCAYSPYVNEMDVWFRHVSDCIVLSPTKYNMELLVSPFHRQPTVISIFSLNFTTLINSVLSIIRIPINIYKVFIEMYLADHIHLRCPGTIGLLGCFTQVFFPNKIKTTKYAGNWNPKAKQPLSYRIQKWVLSNTFLTKNMTVLVYGQWKNQSINIKPFFTATYTKDEIELPKVRQYNQSLKFLFLGSLVEGKRPLLAIKIVEALYEQGKHVYLDIYGDGVLKNDLQSYIVEHHLEGVVRLLGNQEKGVVKEALKEAHFSILPSKSEGWPKALAEAMFFGAIPIATEVSCIADMLGNGSRGILIDTDLKRAIRAIGEHLCDSRQLLTMSEEAVKWSQGYTLDQFEKEIVKLLKA